MAMLVTPHWRSQSRTANTHGSGQIPAGKTVWEDVKKKYIECLPISEGISQAKRPPYGQCPVKKHQIIGIFQSPFATLVEVCVHLCHD